MASVLLILLATLAVFAAAVLGVLVAQGALTLDTGIGRRRTPLGPIEASVAAPRQAVFDVLALPYRSTNPPRAIREKVVVLERGEDMVLAAHRTRVGLLTTTTVEIVTFDEPRAIGFRLVRGPVPEVVERMELVEVGALTRIRYEGELGTDFWLAGRVWGWFVARHWRRTVAHSIEVAREAAERSATRAAGRSAA